MVDFKKPLFKTDFKPREEEKWEGYRVAFTGHRPQKLGGFNPSPLQAQVRKAIREQLVIIRNDHPDIVVVSGMALGVDQWAAEEAIALGIPFIAAVPFEGQEKVWPAQSKATYQTLLKKAQEVVIVSPGGFSVEKLNKRNEWMVDHSNLLIAIWDGSSGGTANCVNYAKFKTTVLRYMPKLDDWRYVGY